MCTIVYTYIGMYIIGVTMKFKAFEIRHFSKILKVGIRQSFFVLQSRI